MPGNILALRGCTPEPLGNYLKGLGVFRLIAEQADPQARAWWKDGFLHVHTKWSRDEVTAFFLHGLDDVQAKEDRVYSPTPIFAPWGGRPGFFKDSTKETKQRLDRIVCGSRRNQRFAPAAETIRIIRDALCTHGWHRSKPKKKQEKSQLVAICRNAWNSRAVDWLDACLALEEEKLSLGFLYGTGGNEGSADITNNFWEFIEEVIGLFETKLDSRDLLLASIFGDSRIGGATKTAGQHFPLAAGSYNCGQEFLDPRSNNPPSSSTNPWDVVLMMEGAVLFAGATTKRLSQFGKGKSAFPFMIDHLPLGEASTSIKDEAKQGVQVTRCRAEFWMPLWHSPTSLQGVRALLSEGRLQRPSGEHAEHSLHAIEAIKSLGVSRGIDTFYRVALFERRGKGSYLASSLGFHPTSRSSTTFAPLLAELDEFRRHVYRNLREGPQLPERVVRARQRFHSALAKLLEHNEYGTITVSDALREVLVTASRIEREVMVLKDRSKLLSPCPALNSAWLKQDDDGHEYRLARAVAGIVAWGEKSADSGPSVAVETIRANLLPVVRRGRAWVWDDTSHSSVWSRGASLEVNLTAVLKRRLIDAEKGSGDGLPLWSSYGAGFGDLLAFWHGEINDERMSDLIYGLALVDTGRWGPSSIDNRQQRDEPTPDLQTGAVWFDADDEARIRLTSIRWRGRPLVSSDDLQAAFELPRVYHLLKLCFVGGRLPKRPVEGQIAARTGDEPFPPRCLDVLTLLQAGRLADAARLAAQRLQAKGYPPLLRDDDLQTLGMSVRECRRLAGMLLIPVCQPGVCAALAIKPAITI